MGLQQLKLGDKVKLELKQPPIKCVGRKDVVCHYRGKVVEIHKDGWDIKIKVFGQETLVTFGNKYGFCLTPGFEDLIMRV